jgi:2-hydroxychromene-2-carboxylate isomerase
MPTLIERSGALVVYGDFGCAMCYLASQRVDELTRAGVAVEWRAVEHRPELPVTGLRPDVDTRSAADRALAHARALGRPGERLPVAGPALVPKTEAAVSAYAEGCGAEVGDEIRRLLFTAYWVDGIDIGNLELLFALLAGTFLRGKATSEPIREFGYAVALNRGPITTRAWRLIRGWNQAWSDLGRPELPVLQNGTRVQSGEQALMQLADEVNQAPMPEAAPNGADLRAKVESEWRPPTTVHPPETWVSQVGDPWARALRMSR